MTEADAPRRRQTLRALYLSVLLGVVLFLLQVAFWHLHIQRIYYPAGDEFSSLVHSARLFHPSVGTWFSRGFADYFNPYPDLSLPYSNFVRPVDNAVYYANSIVFGRSWSAYLLANYAIAAAVVGLTLFLGLTLLDLSPAISSLVVLATAASPAYTAQLVYRPSFVFDYLAAAEVLLVIVFLTRRQLVPAWIFLSLAIFTKEPAFYAAVAASMVVYAILPDRSRMLRLLTSLSFVLPLLCLGVLRMVDFADAKGVYVMNGLSLRALARNVILGMTNWPYIIPGEQHIFDRTPRNILSLLLSFALWMILLRIGYDIARQLGRRGSADPGRLEGGTAPIARRACAIVYLFLLGSLILPILFDLTPRFGASTYPLLFLSMGSLIEHRRSSSLLRFGTAALLLLMTVLNFNQLTKAFSGATRNRESVTWQLSRSLVGRLSEEHHPVTFLVADLSEQFSAPGSLAAFSGYSGQIIPVSNLSAEDCPTPPAVTARQLSPTEFHFEIKVDASCGNNVLYGAFRLDRVAGKSLDRSLPQAEVIYQAQDRPERKEEFLSQDLDIDLRTRIPDFAILVPDLSSGTYIEVIPAKFP